MDDIRKICEGVFKYEFESGPPTKILHGKTLYRFMDFFYIEVETDKLSQEQVRALCHERSNDQRCSQGPNQVIKSLFKDFLINPEITHILEVGAGKNPILTTDEIKIFNKTYIISDADTDYDEIDICFGKENSLDYPDEYFDIVIALFVLHFKFYTHQISQICQHLRSDGIFLANVYKRSDESREQLKRDFEDAGFVVDLIEDPKGHCKNHYFLLAAKNPNSIEINRVKLMNLINNT